MTLWQVTQECNRLAARNQDARFVVHGKFPHLTSVFSGTKFPKWLKLDSEVDTWQVKYNYVTPRMKLQGIQRDMDVEVWLR